MFCLLQNSSAKTSVWSWNMKGQLWHWVHLRSLVMRHWIWVTLQAVKSESTRLSIGIESRMLKTTLSHKLPILLDFRSQHILEAAGGHQVVFILLSFRPNYMRKRCKLWDGTLKIVKVSIKLENFLSNNWALSWASPVGSLSMTKHWPIISFEALFRVGRQNSSIDTSGWLIYTAGNSAFG